MLGPAGGPGVTRARGSDEPVLPRARDRVLTAARTELAEDVPRMRLDGVDRHIELSSDLALGELGGEQPQHRALAVAERVAEPRLGRWRGGGPQPPPGVLEAPEHHRARVGAALEHASRIVEQALGVLALAGGEVAQGGGDERVRAIAGHAAA